MQRPPAVQNQVRVFVKFSSFFFFFFFFFFFSLFFFFCLFVFLCVVVCAFPGVCADVLQASIDSYKNAFLVGPAEIPDNEITYDENAVLGKG